MSHAELQPLEAVLGHHFRHPRWLEQAVTHSTRRLEAAEDHDNERLEFLGDAVVGLVVSHYLAEAFPDWDSGQLSQARARLVSAEALSAAARRIDLGAYLRLGRGEEKTGGREKATLLADAYEALVAALFFDGGLDPAREFIERTLLAQAVSESPHTLGQPDHKSALQEFLQARGHAPAEYRVVSESGPDHRKLFRVEVIVAGRALASAEGGSKKRAEQQAAELALKELRNAEQVE
ncbi:MAG: ribonuclease III [Candidatus Acidiferrales bacterium]